MRWVVRGAAALAGLLVVALIALSVMLPRIAQRPEIKDAAAEAVLDATSHELRFGDVDAGLFPPRLELDAIELVSDAGETTLRADRIALRVALLPLLGRAVVVDRIDVEGPALSLRRTEDGIDFPLRPLE